MTADTALKADEFEMPATAEDLESIATLVNRQLATERLIEAKEEELKALKKTLEQIATILLPTAMFKANQGDFTTADGLYKVSVKEDIAISVPKDKMEAVTAWLESNGHEAVVTAQVIVDLARNSHNERKAAITALTDIGLEPRETTSVNTMTLKTILKAHLAKGDKVELADFGAFAWKKSEIKRLKESKPKASKTP